MNNPDQPPVQGVRPSRPFLQLVHGQPRAKADSWNLHAHQTVCRLALKSSRRVPSADATDIRPSAWHMLAESMDANDTLLLTHRFTPASAGKVRYGFDVQLLRPNGVTARLNEQELLQALHSTLPRWTFAVADELPIDLPIQSVMQPAPLRMTRKGNGRHTDDLVQYMPYPEELPKWYFTRGFDEPISSNAWALQIRIGRAALDAGERVLTPTEN